MILAISDLLPTKFQVNLPFGSSQVQKSFQAPSNGGHLGFWIGTSLAIFDLQVAPIFPPSFESIGFWVQEKKFKIDFQDGSHGSHLGFLTGTILAIFDLQVTTMLPTKFQINLPFGSGEVKNRF